MALRWWKRPCARPLRKRLCSLCAKSRNWAQGMPCSKLRLFCRRAQVPQVCPHSLRGLHASLALQAGATGEMVAQALGHGSFQVTARHYATAESVAGSRAARVAEALGRSDDAISRLLAGLTPEELAELKKRLS